MIFHKCTRCPRMEGPDRNHPLPAHYRGVDLIEEGWLPDGDGFVCPACSGNQAEMPLTQLSMFEEGAA